MNTIGEVPIGEFSVVEIEHSPIIYSFIFGNTPLHSSPLGAYVQQYDASLISFGKLSYIEGVPIYTLGNNELPTWGPTPGVDGVQHKYIPLLSYVNQVVNPATSNRLGFIVSRGIIMRLLTQEGNNEGYPGFVDDSSGINNDGIISGFPEWIVGPHG